MHIVRRLAYHSLSLLFFITIILLAVFGSIVFALSKPTTLENWLAGSGVYSHVGSTFTNQNPQFITISAGRQSLEVPVTTATVQQAIQASFSTQTLKSDAATILNANYTWLKGQSSSPDFQINMAPVKATFTQNVTQYVQNYLSGLPACSINKIQASTAISPCISGKLSSIEPAVSQAVQQYTSSSGFLNNPTVTASSLSQSSQQPYYQKFSWAPRAYTWATRLPWLLTAVALLCFVAMLFAAASKHRALRRTAWLLAVAGIIVSVPKLIVTPVFNAVQKHVPTVNNNSQLQTSFTNLAHSALNGITRTMLIFGISFITVAVIIAVVFILTRKRKPKQPADTPPPPESTPPRPQLPPIHRQTPPRPPLPKRPRLIQ